MNNSVNMIIQDELQPFTKKENVYKMNEMNIHALPWPKNILEALGSTEAELKVTLSYFIEPGPGEIGWKDKYRYQSCGLRFDVINADEGIEESELIFICEVMIRTTKVKELVAVKDGI